MATSTLKLPSCFQTTYFSTYSKQFTVGANTSTSALTITATRAGCYPAGIIGSYPSSNRTVYVRDVTMSGSSGSVTITFKMSNYTSSSVTDTRYFDVLWIKE